MGSMFSLTTSKIAHEIYYEKDDDGNDINKINNSTSEKIYVKQKLKKEK